MDACSTSSKVPTDINVCSFLLQFQDSHFPIPTTLRSNNTVIKYTRVPDFDFDSKALWPQKDSYILQPHLRRIVAINEQDNEMRTSRTLKSELGRPMKLSSASYIKRKILTISEDEERDLWSARTKASDRKPALRLAKANRAVEAVRYEPIRHSQIHSSRPRTVTSRSLKIEETNPSAKPIACNKTLNSSRVFSKSKTSTYHNNGNAPTQLQEKKSRVLQERDNMRKHINLSQNVPQSRISGKEICLIRNKLSHHTKYNSEHKLSGEVPKSVEYNRKSNTLREINTRSKPPIIHVPFNDEKKTVETEITHTKLQPAVLSDKGVAKVDHTSTMDRNMKSRDMNVGTDPKSTKVDAVTEIGIGAFQKTDSNIQTEYFQDACFDNLHIPNVALLKDRSDILVDITKGGNILCSQSFPNLKVPPITITPRKEENNSRAKNFSQSSPYVRTTVTYTSQKIDFHLVQNESNSFTIESHNPLSYPMTAISVFEKESKLQKLTEIEKQKTKSTSELLDSPFTSDSKKFVKPSEIIRTIKVSNGLLESDYVCEQFRKELDFIDSFFESLNYLESCSLSDKCFTNKNVENWVSKWGLDIKNSEFYSLLSKLENDTNIDDTKSMASKSLYLLNLLIHDEQRRANNLLFVLKIREEALKDFTKSQILWLENKKKKDKIDISTLKKKQRGALLKLQHECGEMQRIRKALLILSEKRKLAFMKAKKNIELKLKNHVTVDHILGKKKPNRNSISDRSAVPLKCFELSSSGCEDSTTSRAKSDTAILVSELLSIKNKAKSVEKSIQTGESLISYLVDQTTDTAAENFITVDGGYLNIIFSNLSLPQIFSSGKHYEVNDEALRTIVNSANCHDNALSEKDIVDNFIVRMQNHEEDRSSSPSTARSLVEEFDQYYKVLGEKEKSQMYTTEQKCKDKEITLTLGVDIGYRPETNYDVYDKNTDNSGALLNDFSYIESPKKDEVYNKDFVSESAVNSVNTQVLKGKDSITTATQVGPLPVPAGATASSELISQTTKGSSSTVSVESVLSVSSLANQAAYNEAEELRRQQLAIEREIKALEQQQQQCQLLVVREIPDKPPPPYTPPAVGHAFKLPHMFLTDETIEEKVHKNLCGASTTVSIEPTNAFDVFLQDFCQESAAKNKPEQNEKPWDACNLLPQKPPLDTIKLVQKATVELKEVLTDVLTSTVSGIRARRADHIDEILFSEWRRCEPEWTALHVDEVNVKAQIFEGIFQKILTETVDEYKKTVYTSSDEKATVTEHLSPHS